MANAMAGSRGRIVKTEKESLNPFDNDDEDEMIDVPVPKFDHQRLNFRDCMQLNIEQLEALDRSGYILPNEYKERVLEYREIYHLNHSKNPTIWDYNQRRNAPPPPQETYTGPKFSPNDIYSPQAPPTRPEQRQENLRPVKPWPKGLPRPDQTPPSAENEGTPKPQTITTRQETVVKPSPKVKEEVVEPRPVEKKVGVEANKVEVDEALQYRIPRMRANLYNMDKNK